MIKVLHNISSRLCGQQVFFFIYIRVPRLSQIKRSPVVECSGMEREYLILILALTAREFPY